MEIKIKKLRRFNIIMGTVHLIQGGLLFWLGTVVNSDFVVPITLTQLVGVGSPQDPSSFALVPELEIWREVTNFGPAVATFLLASAVAHYLISGPFYNKYKNPWCNTNQTAHNITCPVNFFSILIVNFHHPTKPTHCGVHEKYSS